MVTLKKINLIIVDDSLFSQTLIKKALTPCEDFNILATAKNAKEALTLIADLSPDIVITDVEMPGMNGFELVRTAMKITPVKFIIMSSLNLSVFEALDAGAVDFVRKPNLAEPGNVQKFSERLISIIRNTSKASLAATKIYASKYNSVQLKKNIPLTLNNTCCSKKIIAIGASTGGTQTITEVLKGFSKNVPGIVIVQHMPAGYTEMFAKRLDQICDITVKEASNGDIINPGTAYIAPGGFQMSIKKTTDNKKIIIIKGTEKISGHCPSIDNMFSSVAQFNNDAIGILLTGMGKDGAEGLLKMHNNNAYTIGQDEKSSIVYGMPKEAYKLGAVTKQLDFADIADDVIRYLSKK